MMNEEDKFSWIEHLAVASKAMLHYFLWHVLKMGVQHPDTFNIIKH